MWLSARRLSEVDVEVCYMTVIVAGHWCLRQKSLLEGENFLNLDPLWLRCTVESKRKWALYGSWVPWIDVWWWWRWVNLNETKTQKIR